MVTTFHDVDTLRKAEFPLTEDTVYLNHASISPLPVQTTEAVSQMMVAMTQNPSRFFDNWFTELWDQFQDVAAQHINAADPLEICEVKSTSTGLNLVAQSIDWKPGDNVIICDTEFPSNAYPWMGLNRYGVETKLVPSDHGTLTVERLQEAVDDRTRLVAVSAIQFFTGGRADLHNIGAFCREHGLLFAVDAMQAIGHMPIDVRAMNIDILSTGAQKSMMALPGSGFLYVRRDLVETLQPASIGPASVEGWEHWTKYDLTPREGTLRFMQGTMSFEGMYSVIKSLGFLRELGLKDIDNHTSELAGRFMDDLEARGFAMVTSRAHHGSIVTFRVSESNEQTAEIVQKLKVENIYLVAHLNAAGKSHLRISLHCYNNDEDRHHFIHSLDAIMKDLGS
ncbi:MAG: aminotransferase class V-fold PLP-dependent enzyme [Chloroflexi bacterium]|nr:aminotransferase class V-fold PLP-dependent enzyme [Chloroflexota bacterium]